jgi:hypothetical protein
MNEQALHHIYEWYQVGSPSARLFDLNYTVSGVGLSISGTFRQSKTMSRDGTEPFYNKAKIMESGSPVIIKPKRSKMLSFNVDGEQIFTTEPVKVENPGGNYVKGSFNKIVDEFMMRYFKQSFFRASGLFNYINNPILYKQEMPTGAKLGKAKGKSVGFKWITNARIGVE